jgi:CRP/FNR family transcriptional regulator, cyclic AMP receptor protein
MDLKLIPNIPLFAGIKRRRQLELAAFADEVRVPTGTTLTREGAHADEFFVIVAGEADVEARRPSPIRASHASTKLASLGPGDFFGEVGLIAGPRRSATVVATTPMHLLAFHPRDFRALMHSFPPVAERVRTTFVERSST